MTFRDDVIHHYANHPSTWRIWGSIGSWHIATRTKKHGHSTTLGTWPTRQEAAQALQQALDGDHPWWEQHRAWWQGDGLTPEQHQTVLEVVSYTRMEGGYEYLFKLDEQL